MSRGEAASPKSLTFTLQAMARNYKKDHKDVDGYTISALKVIVSAFLLVNAPLLTGRDLLNPTIVAKSSIDDNRIKKVFK